MRCICGEQRENERISRNFHFKNHLSQESNEELRPPLVNGQVGHGIVPNLCGIGNFHMKIAKILLEIEIMPRLGSWVGLCRKLCQHLAVTPNGSESAATLTIWMGWQPTQLAHPLHSWGDECLK